MSDTIGVIKFQGLDVLLKNLTRLPEEVQKRISMEMEASCMTIVRNAKRAAPINVGRLKQGITYVKHSALSFEIISAANYSAYMEFGTKGSTVVPAGFEEIAAEFKGVSIDSGGVSLKQAIYTWAKQKGIDPKLWFVIYRKIAVMGVKPHPFFIPALIELKRLEQRIQKYTNKIDE
jgi:HK97 gp10 family phage protein